MVGRREPALGRCTPNLQPLADARDRDLTAFAFHEAPPASLVYCINTLRYVMDLETAGVEAPRVCGSHVLKLAMSDPQQLISACGSFSRALLESIVLTGLFGLFW